MHSLLPVQPFQETLHASMCGPASLKMVLAYYGVEKTEQELAVLAGTDVKLGTSAEGIQKAAEGLGFHVEIKNNSSLPDMQTWLDKKVPVIVDWFTRGRSDYPDAEMADGHYSVVVGLDEKCIYLQDPEIGNLRTIPRDDFLRVWFDFKGDSITSWDDMIFRQLIAIYK
jgi:predicted double-glycine peptidase